MERPEEQKQPEVELTIDEKMRQAQEETQKLFQEKLIRTNRAINEMLNKEGLTFQIEHIIKIVSKQ